MNLSKAATFLFALLGAAEIKTSAGYGAYDEIASEVIAENQFALTDDEFTYLANQNWGEAMYLIKDQASGYMGGMTEFQEMMNPGNSDGFQLTFPVCRDERFFFWTNKQGKIKGDCDYVAEKPKQRCRKDASEVSFFNFPEFDTVVRKVCPIACEYRPCTCEDRSTRFVVNVPFVGKKLEVSCDRIGQTFGVPEDPFELVFGVLASCTIPKVRTNCPNLCGACAGIPQTSLEIGLIAFYLLIQFAGVNQWLSFPNGPFSVFGPSDDAIINLLFELAGWEGEYIGDLVCVASNQEILADIVGNHVVEGIIPIGAGEEFENVIGGELFIEEVNSTFFVVQPQPVLVVAELTEAFDSLNGEIFPINEVLLPEDIFDLVCECKFPGLFDVIDRLIAVGIPEKDINIAEIVFFLILAELLPRFPCLEV